ncbi:MAG: EamA family transporter [Alphaproteobacteria bacterium]|nr:EamA family transporter [Alphaproteobacteria bacterium]
MDGIDVAAALLSAVLHASWNAAIKASARPQQAMTAQMVLSALIVLPGLLWTGLPPLAAWPWIAATTAMNVVTIGALLRAYERAGFGVAYPVVRAVAVLLVVPLAALVAGDRPGAPVALGVLIIALALATLAWDAARDSSLSLEALGWALLAGAVTAGYILCDVRGVRATGSPWSYGFAVSLTNALGMCWRARHGGAPWRQVRAEWRIALPAAVASAASYLLILWVWSHAPVAPAAALRDTSALFAILIAVIFLHEPFTRRRVAAVLLAAAAVPLLRLG